MNKQVLGQTVRRTQSTDQWWWGGLIICLVVTGSQLAGFLKPVIYVSELAVTPIQKVGVRIVQIGPSAWSSLQHVYRLERQIQSLELNYNRALVQLSELQGVKEENQQLRALLENTNRKFLPSVLAVPIISYGLPAVTVGTEQQIETGAAVMVQQTLVGRVRELRAQQASVELLFQSSVTPVLVKTETGATGVVKGDGKRVVLTEVSLDEELVVGQRIVTVAQPGIRADILVGTVQSIERNQASPVQSAVVSQTVSFYGSRVVEVTLP